MTAAAALDETLFALADPTRRGVVELLRKKPRRAGELAEALSLSAPLMSRHLRVLRSSGLVTEASLDGDARVRVYRLQPEKFAELRSWISEVETVWTLELSAFKAHAERSRPRKRKGLAK